MVENAKKIPLTLKISYGKSRMALSFFRLIIGTLVVLLITLAWSMIAKDTKEKLYIKLFVVTGLWIMLVSWLAA